MCAGKNRRPALRVRDIRNMVRRGLVRPDMLCANVYSGIFMIQAHPAVPRVSESTNPLTHDIDVASPVGIVRLLRQSDAQLFAGYGTWEGLMDAAILNSLTQVVFKQMLSRVRIVSALSHGRAPSQLRVDVADCCPGCRGCLPRAGRRRRARHRRVQVCSQRRLLWVIALRMSVMVTADRALCRVSSSVVLAPQVASRTSSLESSTRCVCNMVTPKGRSGTSLREEMRHCSRRRFVLEKRTHTSA